MKKITCGILVFVLIFSLSLAETVYVSISDDHGNLALAYEPVEVSDLNGDGAINIDEALHSAHELAYPGGAELGYESLDMGFGLSMNRLWGIENGGSYGYYLNNGSAISLLDEISDGDAVYAYAFTDLETWSDTYSFFDSSMIEATGTFELTLSAQSFDAAWNPVCLPVEGAVITIDGVNSDFVTDMNGKVQIELPAGEYLISATSEQITLVPPVCRATVVAAE